MVVSQVQGNQRIKPKVLTPQASILGIDDINNANALVPALELYGLRAGQFPLLKPLKRCCKKTIGLFHSTDSLKTDQIATFSSAGEKKKIDLE